MIIDLKGEIKKIYPVKQISDNLTICDFVITIGSNGFTQDIVATLKNEKVDLIKGFQVGMVVTAKCYLNGREKDGKHFVSLGCFDLIGKYNND